MKSLPHSKEMSLKSESQHSSSCKKKPKLEAASTNRSSSAGILSSPEEVQLCLSGIRINGEEDDHVGRSIATYWEDAMFHDYPSF